MSEHEFEESMPSENLGDVTVDHGQQLVSELMYLVDGNSLKEKIWNWYAEQLTGSGLPTASRPGTWNSVQWMNAESHFRKWMDQLPTRKKVSRETTRKILNGQITHVKGRTLKKYATVLGVAPCQLVAQPAEADLAADRNGVGGARPADGIVPIPDGVWLLDGPWVVSLQAANLAGDIPWVLTKEVVFESDGGLAVRFCIPVESGSGEARWLFDGQLSEGGTVISGNYSFDQPDGKRKHGSVMAVRLNSNEIRGQFVGRNIDFQPNGIIHGELQALKVLGASKAAS